MGRKRTDQWQEEAGEPDRKSHPEELNSPEREFSEAVEGKFAREQPIPPKVLEPDTERARAEELERQEHLHERQRPKQRSRKRS